MLEVEVAWDPSGMEEEGILQPHKAYNKPGAVFFILFSSVLDRPDIKGSHQEATCIGYLPETSNRGFMTDGHLGADCTETHLGSVSLPCIVLSSEVHRTSVSLALVP